MQSSQLVENPRSPFSSSPEKPMDGASAGPATVSMDASPASLSQKSADIENKTPVGSPNGKSKKKRNSLGSKTYMEVVHEAIVSLKGRNGSSIPAIHKWILAHHPDLECPQFKSRVMQAIKSGTKLERFIKVKCSYKISAAYNKAKKRKKPAAAAASSKKLVEVKQANAKKLAELQKTLSAEEYAKVKRQISRQEANAKKKLKAEELAKERAEKLKRRRLPMEDTLLHKEDALYNVKTPADLLPRPSLPYFWSISANRSSDGKTSGQVLNASKVDAAECGNRGLVPDLLQVYHFFQGDINFGIAGHRELVPRFTLRNLVFATEQVLNGNAKRSRCVPPLLVHLFCVSLQILCRKPDGEELSPTPTGQMQKDLHMYLAPALNPASWADVLFLYMDAMERFYGSDASLNPNVIPPLKSDVAYLLSLRDEVTVPLTPVTSSSSEQSQSASSAPLSALTDGYHGYLGDPKGALSRAYMKLSRQDPWLLSADELLSMLRALTDDILASHPAISEDMADRDEAMQKLTKAKRAADANLRKVRLAFEGPKKPSTSKKAGNDEKSGPRATRRQFDTAERAQQKATEAYEKGLQDLTSRTGPIGHDRHFNAVYCFRHDPDLLFVEDAKPPSSAMSHLPVDMQIKRRSWHVIETTSLFDKYVGSLDIRGRREHDLYQELVGPPGSQHSIRRFLLDEKDTPKGEAVERDYLDLTGYKALAKFDKSVSRESRRSRSVLQALSCSSLRPTGALDGSGLVGIIVADMLHVEKLCQALAPWERDDVKRDQWVESVELAAIKWNSVSPIVLGPPDTPAKAVIALTEAVIESPVRGQGGTSSTDSINAKRRRVETTPISSAAFHSAANIVSMVRQPLIDLEARVAAITNLDIAAQDAILADDNMSTDGSDDEQDQDLKEKLEVAWKKRVYRLKETPAQRSGVIRQLLIDAIADARKAHLPLIVADLRSALLFFQPSAALQCKTAAVQVLNANGGYDGEDDDDDEDDAEGAASSEEVVVIPSVISAEAAVLGGCLSGAEDSTRNDWITAVKSCRTISRLASLVSAFRSRAEERMRKCEQERDELIVAMGKWEKAKERHKKQLNGKRVYKSKEHVFPSEVWANVSFKNELCMAKLEGEPFWPARKCVAKDETLAKSLERVGRSLVAIVGELGGLRVVKNEELAPFTGKIAAEDDLSNFSRKTKEQLSDYLAMSRRIARGLNLKVES